MTLTMDMITFDTADPGPLAAWWAEQVGGTSTAEDGGFYVVHIDGVGYRLAFQKVEDPTPGKNRIHLDLSATDLDAEVQRLLAAGAEQVDTHALGDFRWVVLADPQGNQFCVAGEH
ncbi:VOC family protein [Ruania halotolerans]|uniref:VOC family protein n=1 Tax=Ruania halotolerans TaxID=2897773 RepID=UPI001E3A8C4F|nr:VOC family protein [Ruania halotolerans]UFU06388.1 VOC family protein [Ruania halotolerans]